MNRSIEVTTVTKTDGRTITYSTGWTHVLPEKVAYSFSEGDTVLVETTLSRTMVTGVAKIIWAYQKTDEDLANDSQAFRNKVKAKQEAFLRENRADMEVREAALPDWLKTRLALFREKGGEAFELQGWNYELIICELAVIYTGTKLADTDEVDEFAKKYGTSGNQHEVARLLARVHMAGESFGVVPSGLFPITGNPDYSPQD